MGQVRTRFRMGPGSILAAALLAGTSFTGLAAIPGIAMAQSAQVSFAVPGGALGPALNEFGRQANLQVSFLAGAAAGKTTSGVSGAMDVSAALDRLLAGTGLSYSFDGARSVTIAAPAAVSAADQPYDGSIVLEEVNVTGWVDGAGATAPYETPGSSSYIDGEQLNRIPVTSTGDIFKSVPGVIVTSNRGSGTIDVNIRGLQGAGRVATLVDGTSAQTSAYKGYAGNQSRTSVDAALLSGVTVEKGPATGPQGIGSIGGVVNMTTINAEDVLLDGRQFGVMVKGTLGNNSIEPILNGDMAYKGTARLDGAGEIDLSSLNGAVAVAATSEMADFLLAYSSVNQGNYFAGSNGSTTHPDTGAVLSPIPLGAEVYNTSRNTDTLLAKGTLRFGDGQSLKVTVQKYHGLLGETYNEALNFSGIYGFADQEQSPLTERDVTTGKLEYRWNPSGNDLIDLHANVWSTYTEESAYVSPPSGTVAGMRDYATWATGVEVWNTSRFSTVADGLEVSYGLQYLDETAESEYTTDPNGDRQLIAGFTQAKLDVNDWLTLQGGLRAEGFAGDTIATDARSLGRVNPNIGITVSPLAGLQLFATYAEGWRPPSIRELNGQASVSPNPDLRPEVSKSFEIGANYLARGVFTADDSVKLKVAYFDSTYDDYIARMRIGSSDSWGNLDEATYRGIEISGAYDMGKVFVEGSFNYYTDIEYCLPGVACGTGTGRDFGGNQVPPVYSGSLTVGTRLLEDEALTLGATVNFVGEQYEVANLGIGGNHGNTINMAKWAPSQIVGLFGSYKVNENLELNASVENLFDTYYLDGMATALVPAPGRTVKLGLTGKF